MSTPVKRSLLTSTSDHDGGVDSGFIDDDDVRCPIPPKRLRGGGGGDDDEDDFDFPEDDVDLDNIDEELAEMPIPEDVDGGGGDDGAALSAVFSDISENMRKRWHRPQLTVQDNKADVSVQWFDMDLQNGTPLSVHPNELLPDRSRITGSQVGQVPVIRAYGVTEDGNSATIFIHGYTPYGYFALPAGATLDPTPENLAQIRQYLDAKLADSSRGQKLEEYCRAVYYVDNHKSIMGYESPHTHFLRVYVAMPTLIPTLKRIMEESSTVLPCVESPNSNYGGSEPYAAFECNVPFVLRYMIDRDISGAGWLTLPAQTYQIRTPNNKQTHCQVCYG